MLFTLCQTCKLALHIVGREEELVELFEGHPEWKRSFPCAAPFCSGRALRVAPAELAESETVKTVPAQAYFRALYGFGLPDAPKVTMKAVKELLLSQAIVDVFGFDTGDPERVILEGIVLADGTRLHLASSSKGACIYHIEAEVKNETDQHPVRTTEGGAADREEARRGAGGAEEAAADAGAESVPLQDAGVPALPEDGGVHPGDQGGGDRARDDEDLRLRSAANEAPA